VLVEQLGQTSEEAVTPEALTESIQYLPQSHLPVAVAVVQEAEHLPMVSQEDLVVEAEEELQELHLVEQEHLCKVTLVVIAELTLELLAVEERVQSELTSTV
jgi:hypothetical protein